MALRNTNVMMADTGGGNNKKPQTTTVIKPSQQQQNNKPANAQTDTGTKAVTTTPAKTTVTAGTVVKPGAVSSAPAGASTDTGTGGKASTPTTAPASTVQSTMPEGLGWRAYNTTGGGGGATVTKPAQTTVANDTKSTDTGTGGKKTTKSTKTTKKETSDAKVVNPPKEETQTKTGTVKGTEITKSPDNGTGGTLYDEVKGAYDALQAEKDAITAALNDIKKPGAVSSAPAGAYTDTGTGGQSVRYDADATNAWNEGKNQPTSVGNVDDNVLVSMFDRHDNVFNQPLIDNGYVVNGEVVPPTTKASDGGKASDDNTGGGGANGGDLTKAGRDQQDINAKNVDPTKVKAATTPATDPSGQTGGSGADPAGGKQLAQAATDNAATGWQTFVLRNGQKIPAQIINGRTYDMNGNPFSFQVGDYVNTQDGYYEWDGTKATRVTEPGSPGNLSSVDPSNPPSLIDMTPEEAIANGAVEVPIYGPNGERVGTGYIINGVTYFGNEDGYLSRLTNDTEIPYIVRTQGGDYVMTKDGSFTLEDYENKYGPISNWVYQGGTYIYNGGTVPGMTTPTGSEKPMVDYSGMTEDDLINYVMNAIMNNDEAALRDFMTWAEAESIARERMNPLYNQYIDQSMRDIDLKALQGGFYGQLPTEALRQKALAETEGNRTQAIIDYATQLLNADREGVLEEAKLNLDERQQRVATLMSLLESMRSMSEAEKERELKKWMAEQDSLNAKGELDYKYWAKGQDVASDAADRETKKWIAQLS